MLGSFEVWTRMAVCHKAMGDLRGALQVHESLVQSECLSRPSPVTGAAQRSAPFSIGWPRRGQQAACLFFVPFCFVCLAARECRHRLSRAHPPGSRQQAQGTRRAPEP